MLSAGIDAKAGGLKITTRLMAKMQPMTTMMLKYGFSCELFIMNNFNVKQSCLRSRLFKEV